jgi:Zn-dependent protease with chaperone function
LRFAFARHHDPADTATVANLLAQAGEDWDPDNSADNSARDGTSTNTSTKKPNSFWAIVTLPVLMAGGAFMMNDLVFTMLLVNPLLRRAWRARRYLADATAVQLTRNPQGLARALSKLGASAAVVPGAEWAGHVFVVGDPRHEAKGSPLVDFNPRLDRRVERLDRLGADVPLPPPRRKLTGKQRLVVGVLATLVSPLLIAAVLAMFAAALMLTSISLFIDMMFLFAPLAVVHHFMRQAAR